MLVLLKTFTNCKMDKVAMLNTNVVGRKLAKKLLGTKASNEDEAAKENN